MRGLEPWASGRGAACVRRRARSAESRAACPFAAQDEDDIEDFVAGSDESEDEGEASDGGVGGGGSMHMAMHLEHQLGGGGFEAADSESEEGEEGEEGVEGVEGVEEGEEAAAAGGGAAPAEGEEGEEDEGESDLEYYSEPDALELAEQALREKKKNQKRLDKGLPPKRAVMREPKTAAAGPSQGEPQPKRPRTVIQLSDDED